MNKNSLSVMVVFLVYPPYVVTENCFIFKIYSLIGSILFLSWKKYFVEDTSRLGSSTEKSFHRVT